MTTTVNTVVAGVNTVVAGLVPAIHDFAAIHAKFAPLPRQSWMAGTRPAMTV